MPEFDYESLRSRYTPFLSKRDCKKVLVKFWDAPPGAGVIEMAGGMPNEGFFPVGSIDVHVLDKPFQRDTREDGLVAHMERDKPSDMPLSLSLQYTNTEGMDPLLQFVKCFSRTINPPAYGGWDVCLADGSSDGLSKVFEMLCDEDSTVMMEEFTFVPVMSSVQTQGGHVVPVKMQLSADPKLQGIDVEEMAEMLDHWHEGPYRHLKKPKALYTIATGQNPTGMTLSPEKRAKIYQMAQRHDFLIVEDDPYGYLVFPPYDPEDPLKNTYWSDKSLTPQRYVDDYLVKSFLTIDTDARVIRLETFSKLFAPGLRLSFVVANRFFIQRIVNIAEVTTRAPSGVSQALVYTVIKEMGTRHAAGKDPTDAMLTGWLHWLMKVAGFYTHRRNITFKSLFETKAYRQGLFKVMEPSAGMFIDLKPAWPQADLAKADHFDHIMQAMDHLNSCLLKNGVQVVLGHRMAVDREGSKDTCDFIRITIAYAKDDEQIVEACHRIAAGFQEFFEQRQN